MESLSPTLFSSPSLLSPHCDRKRTAPLLLPSLRERTLSTPLTLALALKTPRGFGPQQQKTKKRNDSNKDQDRDDEFDDDDDEEKEVEYDSAAGTIPESVTNRMMRRVGVTVGSPLAVGLLFFPFFYYLKVIRKIDVPTWVPFIVSFVFFGTALLGVSYGIVSASWDPLREGSLLGWNEAKKNWPVFWDSLWRSSEGSKRSRRTRRR